MRLQPADPDIRTLVERIRDGSIDLQPDFQRGIVWPLSKQQKLIDSIIRDWHVPPIHLIRDDDENEVVLDGQQRLEAIRSFMADQFPVDGSIEPHDPAITKLDGVRFSNLPERVRKRIERFTIRVFTIVDYETEEPFELFYRLNQPTVLTASEQRNAFFGKAREQVRELVAFAIDRGLTREKIGFSNSRMAYDDVIARFCLTLERNDISEKLTSSDITQTYRSKHGFSAKAVDQAQAAIGTFLSLPAFDDQIRLNKATLFTWLVFVFTATHSKQPSSAGRTLISGFLQMFEVARTLARTPMPSTPSSVAIGAHPPDETESLLRVFNDRSIARVSDASSVVLRDFILWIMFASLSPAARSDFPRARKAWRIAPPGVIKDPERELSDLAISHKWGELQ